MFFTSSQSRRCKLFSDLTLRWESSPAPSLNYSHSDLSIKPQRSERTLECCPLGHAPLVLLATQRAKTDPSTPPTTRWWACLPNLKTSDSL